MGTLDPRTLQEGLLPEIDGTASNDLEQGVHIAGGLESFRAQVHRGMDQPCTLTTTIATFTTNNDLDHSGNNDHEAHPLGRQDHASSSGTPLRTEWVADVVKFIEVGGEKGRFTGWHGQ